jgi:hypothetical protein
LYLQKQESAAKVCEELEQQMTGMKMHSFRISHQLHHNRHIVHHLQDDECVIHVDFSENYSGKMHEEIQSYHFGGSHPQITIHHGMLYTKARLLLRMIDIELCLIAI